MLVAAFAASSAFTLPRPATFARKLEVARRAADDAADGVDDDAAAARSGSMGRFFRGAGAVCFAAVSKASFSTAVSTASSEGAATKFVKTAANPVTWKNGIYAGSLAIAVLLPVALLALAQK